MKNIKLFVLLIYILFIPQFACPIEGGIEYNDVYIDYSDVDTDKLKTDAEEYYNKTLNSKNKKTQNENYAKSVGAYQILIKLYPYDAELMAKIGHIYGKMNRPDIAKSYLDRGINLAINNPMVNYYYGIFYDDEKDYRNALKFYNNAYKYGMEDDVDLNIRLAVINSKLGELEAAKKYYQQACKLNNNTAQNKQFTNKIRQIDDLIK